MRKAAASPRCAIYCRTSTREQHLLGQFRQLRQLAQLRGFKIVRVYRERRSAFKHRPAHSAAMADAMMNRFDVLLCWSIDRWGRSLVELLGSVERLAERSVAFVSAKEAAIDTTTASGKLVLSILAAAAEFERNRLIERTKVGMELARKRNKQIGRPRANWNPEQAKAWHASGVSAAEIARRFGVSERTARRNLTGKRGTVRTTGVARGGVTPSGARSPAVPFAGGR